MASPEPLLEALRGVLNAREVVAGLATGGQPGLETLPRLAKAGCQLVVDMRDPMEAQPFDPPAAVRNAGLDYVNLPVPHFGVSDGTLDQVRTLVSSLLGRGGKAFLYCNSGNRVGAALVPYFILDRGMTEEEAVTLAMRIGTRSTELLDQVLDYVRRRR